MKQPHKQDMYAALAPDDWQQTGHRWWDFYDEPWMVVECGNPKSAVRHVRISPDEKGLYWAWWDKAEGQLMFFYPELWMVSGCFPYGVRTAEEIGQGKAMRVRVEEIP